MVPGLAGVAGLALAYRAQRQARAGGGEGSSEKLARTAVIVGWGGVAYSLLPMCVAAGMVGGEWVNSICDELSWALSDLF